ncbi:MAG: hypothetical protein ACTIAG_05495 [Lactobacillus sp.]
MIKSKYQKYLLLIVLLVSLLIQGIMLSNIQSRLADDLLEAHGLSNNSRYLELSSRKSVSSFLRTLKPYRTAIQVHLENQYERGQVLVWSNQSVTSMPTYVGHYFTSDDFQGMVSFAVVEYGSRLNTKEVQGNKYLIVGRTYYAVIGQLKPLKAVSANQYFLSTGVDQPTGKTTIANYRVLIDSSNRVISKIAKQYHAKVTSPAFVKAHHHHRWSFAGEFMVIAVLILLGLAIHYWLANQNWRRINRLGQSPQDCWQYFVRVGMRFGLLTALLAIISYFFLSFHAFYSAIVLLASLFLLNLILSNLAYFITGLKLRNRES